MYAYAPRLSADFAVALRVRDCATRRPASAQAHATCTRAPPFRYPPSFQLTRDLSVNLKLFWCTECDP
ncbi:hypothetical protein K1T71_001303 [Dendrolimus kikuchii]|uniref:Uncharacterized protein n=1 Tax=Dendrolimus kikuchii TaxID=765133 RepID=A0ACC1DI93_9NEOP|nr:hypothetical protein K1T71_001303 [Dendrolimus kikuchii]